MRITLRVAGHLDFSKYEYELILNTSGSNLTPEVGRNRTRWDAYSASLNTSGGHRPYAEVTQYVPSRDPNTPPQQVRLITNAAQLQFDPDAKGFRSAFSITFARSILEANSLKVTNRWHFNATALRARGLVDSLGGCGTCYKSPTLDVNSTFNLNIRGSSTTAPPDARIESIQIENRS